jgi:structural maintenance of chromosome 1
LYQIEESMETNSRTVIAKNKDLAGLREEQRVHDEALAAARAEQAKVRATVMQKEKGIKKADKALDGKVRISRSSAALIKTKFTM